MVMVVHVSVSSVFTDGNMGVGVYIDGDRKW